jgi:hypothetical protein
MVLIFSSGIYDSSTDKVIDWLYSEGIKFYKISPFSIGFQQQIELIDNKIFLNNEHEQIELIPAKIRSIWLRKWDVQGEVDYYLKSKKISGKSQADLRALYISEINAIFRYLCHQLHKCKWYPKPSALDSNKLIQVIEANKIGFKVPKSKVGFSAFLDEDLSVSKLIDTHFSYQHDGENYHAYTSLINKNERSNFPSLIQENILKNFELRVLYFDGFICSTAILSQANLRTSMDYRRYDYSNENRFVPYQLSSDLTSKIDDLMQSLDINTGSIDLIYGKDKEFYFLELNPFGQFGELGRKCHHEIEKNIALILIQPKDVN